MRKVSIATCFFAVCLTLGQETEQDSTRVVTCRDLVNQVKASDCLKPVSRFLYGATVVLGMGLNSSRMTLKRQDTTVALLNGLLTPAPYYGFSLPRRYFGSSGFGWAVSLAYSSSVAVLQNIHRDGKDQNVDLGTYGMFTLGAASPALFYTYGARDEDPEKHIRFGIGLGLGLGSVRGTAYYTEAAEDSGSTACMDAATRYAGGNLDKAGLKSICKAKPFNRITFGGSYSIFIDGRWKFLYVGIDINSLRLLSGTLELEPVELSLKLAYIHDL